MRRVVVTGMAGLSPLGESWEQIQQKLRAGISGLQVAAEYGEYSALRSRLAGKVELPALPEHYDRRRLRSMSRGALLAVRASELALIEAGLIGDQQLQRAGVAYGSCLGGAETLMRLGGAWQTKSLKGILPSSYVQVMSHCCAANISLFFGLQGRMIPTCSACTSGSQAIGYAFESIKHGYLDLMVAGGAEELNVGLTGLFDALGAATGSIDPETASCPFSDSRDGLVISEGAATLVLEELTHAEARGARIFAEIVGFATNCDGVHLTNPEVERMQEVLEASLNSARLSAEDIDVVHAHATATELGDVAESQAVARVIGATTPITATKSYQGHTLGAAGALESWFAISMLNEGWFAPIRALQRIDPRCAELDYIVGEGRSFDAQTVMVNNFAFGGVNTSLIFKRY